MTRHFTLPGGEAGKTKAFAGTRPAWATEGSDQARFHDKQAMHAGFFVRIVIAASIALALSPPIFAGPLSWQGSLEIASGRGERGPWQQNDSRYDYVDDPAVAIDDQGEISVVWVEQARKDVFFQRLSAEGKRQLATPVNVSRSPATFSWLPRIIIAPDDQNTIFILWQEILFAGGAHGGDIVFARSTDGGRTFSSPRNLSQSVGGDGKGRINKEVWHNGSLDLVAGRDGALYAAWTEYGGQLWFVRSTDGGNTFSRPQHLAGGGNAKPVRAPSLALGPGRNIYLAWTTGEDDAADIHLMQSDDGGASFGELHVVARTNTYSDAPKLAVDRGGIIHLAHAESSGGPFGQYRVRYLQSPDGGRSFTAPREMALPAADTGAAFPSLAIDDKGRLLILWERYQSRQQRPRGLALVASQDGGRSFSEPLMVPESSDPEGGANGSHQGLLMEKLAMNSAGAVAIVNSSLKQDAASRVWLIRGKLAR